MIAKLSFPLQGNKDVLNFSFNLYFYYLIILGSLGYVAKITCIFFQLFTLLPISHTIWETCYYIKGGLVHVTFFGQ